MHGTARQQDSPIVLTRVSQMIFPSSLCLLVPKAAWISPNVRALTEHRPLMIFQSLLAILYGTAPVIGSTAHVEGAPPFTNDQSELAYSPSIGG